MPTAKKAKPEGDKPAVKRAPRKASVAKAKVEKSVDKNEEEIVVKEETMQNPATKKFEYLYAVGRRKTAIAQVRVYKKGTGKITVNEKDYTVAFPLSEQQEMVVSPLRVVGQLGKLDITAKVLGGGQMSQSEAVRHGLSRALTSFNPNFRKPLKKAGYLTRDARRKERKKPGLKRARKAPQFSKR